MKERNLPLLESSVETGLSHFDSVSQFSAKYGQSPAAIALLRGYLARFGITTDVIPGNVDIQATGTAGEFDSALSVTTMNFHVPAHNGPGGFHVNAQTVFSATGAPALPLSIAPSIDAILGLSNYAPFSTHAVKAAAPAVTQPSATTGDAPQSFLPADFAANYGLDPLYNKTNGAGESIGIVTLAALDVGGPEFFWQNVAGVPTTGRNVTVDNVDGGPGAPTDASGSGETDLDTEQSGGLAPGANVIVYQAPNTDPGFVDGFFTAAGQNAVDTLSSSWGESETTVSLSVAAGAETAAYESAFDEAFLELADQGQSAFVSAGDDGAFDAQGDAGSTNLAVDVPGDSPFVTSSGGTTLPWSGTITGPDGSAQVSVTTQRAWAWDYLWPAIAQTNGVDFTTAAKADVVGGGGGFSVIEPKPSYQQRVPGTSNFHAVNYLTPIDPENLLAESSPPGNFTEPTDWTVNQTPQVVAGFGTGRVEPDVSADADPESGYLLYEPSFATADPPQPVLQSGWGGTSFVAPQLNGSTAVIDAFLGHRIGLWNPSIYRLAGTQAVTPLSSANANNDNTFYTGNPGQPFNPATGLGTPNLVQFATELAQRP